MEFNDKGWIKLYRILLDKPIWTNSTPEQCKILITLLLMANHEEAEWEWQREKFKVKPGQFITSLDNIVKKCGKGISIQNVRTSLKRFEELKFLTNKSTKNGRLISIENWELYQYCFNDINKGSNIDLTKTQQSPNKELTPNKNDKNNKNNKKDKYMDLTFIDDVIDKVKLTQEQYEKLVSKFGKTLVNNQILSLDSYIVNGKGAKYKDHYRALNTWCNKNYTKEVRRKNIVTDKDVEELYR